MMIWERRLRRVRRFAARSPFAVGGLLLLILAAAECRRNEGSTTAITSGAGTHPDIVPVMSGVGVEERLTSIVGGREPYVCTSTQAGGHWEGPCRRFTIINPRSGTLVAALTWDNQHVLILSLKTLDGLQKGMGCCRSSQTLKLAVEAGSVYEVQVTLLKTWGSDETQKFHLTLSLEP